MQPDLCRQGCYVQQSGFTSDLQTKDPARSHVKGHTPRQVRITDLTETGRRLSDKLARDEPEDDDPMHEDVHLSEGEGEGEAHAPPLASGTSIVPLPKSSTLTTKAAKALAQVEKTMVDAGSVVAVEEDGGVVAADEGAHKVNSTTHKKDYKKFYTECRNRKKFPASLAAEYTREPMNLFKLWLEKKGP